MNDAIRRLNLGCGFDIRPDWVNADNFPECQPDLLFDIEHVIAGEHYPMELHLVHKDAEGRLAVVAVLLERGRDQPLVQTIWNNLPLEKGDEVAAKAPIDVSALLPNDRRYYTYMGSLTTPPCSEGVLWMVMKQPVPVSPEQIGIFARLYPMNARPIQSASGWLIKESN